MSIRVAIGASGTPTVFRSKLRVITGEGIEASVTDDPNENELELNLSSPESGAQVLTRRTVVPPYTVASDDYVLHANGTGTVTLPAHSDGRSLRIKRINALGDVTLSPPSGTIDGAASLVLSGQYQSVDLISDGSNWLTH